MTRITLVTVAVLLTLFSFSALEVQSETINEHARRESSPMWFGPRIGRKKRNPETKINLRNDKEILDILRNLREDSLATATKHNTFIPRLGRQSGDTWVVSEEEFSDPDTSVPNLFNPRLGRNEFNPFSPRLGRESDGYL